MGFFEKLLGNKAAEEQKKKEAEERRARANAALRK
ncbi:MAG: hypothetical protein BWY53_00676 [Parcubacteria group bacterium ADurb.Bin326]|nr:MAG: hypothetical protein BWY53_00676 [Parcubacteria group bacterium ADurb.Bin326]